MKTKTAALAVLGSCTAAQGYQLKTAVLPASLLFVYSSSHLSFSADIPRLPVVERKEIFSVIFDITAYRAPPNIQLPDGYKSPSLAISKLYWKGWILLLVLSAFNPKTIGAYGRGRGWEEGGGRRVENGRREEGEGNAGSLALLLVTGG